MISGMTESERVGPGFDHLLETEIDGDISLYDPRTEKVTVLNQTASDVWRLADGSHTLDEMVHLLAAAYQTEPEAIATEVRQTVDHLAEAGLLPER